MPAPVTLSPTFSFYAPGRSFDIHCDAPSSARAR